MGKVVRTGIHLMDPSRAKSVGEVHPEVFGNAPPAATMVVVKALLDPVWLVEIEAEAVLESGVNG